MARSSTSFQPGNTMAVRTGAQSPRLVRSIVQVRGRRLRRELGQRSEIPLQRLAIELEARLSGMAAYLDANGGNLVTSRGKVRGCASLYLSLSGRLLSVYDRLGIGKGVLEDSLADDPLAQFLQSRRQVGS